MELKYSSEIVSLAAMLAAVGGLIFTEISLRAHSKANDAKTLFLILNEIRMAEANLYAAAKKSDEVEREIVSYINLLEALAATNNHSLLNKVTRKIARDRLINDIAMLQVQEFTSHILEKATTSPSTFEELKKFCRENKKDIQEQEAIHRARDRSEE